MKTLTRWFTILLLLFSISSAYALDIYTTAPTVNDDIDKGYIIGNQWFNSVTGITYVCQANTDGAAVWATPLTLVPTTSSTTGVIYKSTDRFIHNFKDPTGGGAVPDGKNTFVGINAGNFTMGSTATNAFHGSYNIGIGDNTLSANTTGYYNVAVGQGTLMNNTTGRLNVAIGKDALLTNTTGYGNVGIGANSLYYNLDGYYNVGIGYNTLQENTSGYKNIAIGYQALVNNTTGYGNMGIGDLVLSYNTTGNSSIAIGNEALQKNTTGGGNVAVGSGAMNANTKGSYNEAIGLHALFYNTTGNYNVAIGWNSLYRNTTGTQNAAIVLDALYSNTTGSDNIAIGESALYNLKPTSKAITAFADSATSPGVKTTVTSASHGQSNGTTVQITGTTTYNGSYETSNVATDTFDIVKVYTVNDATGWWGILAEGRRNISLGRDSGYAVTTGSGNILLGYQAGNALTTGANNIIIGYDIDADSATGSNQLNIGGAIKGNLSTKVIDFPGTIRLLETGLTPTLYTTIQSGDLTGAGVTLTTPIWTSTLAEKTQNTYQVCASGCPYTTLNAAITGIGATQATVIVSESVATTTATVPATMTVQFTGQGLLTLAAGELLTFNGKLVNPSNQQIFSYAADGADSIVNGTFATDTDWTKGAGWTIAGGVAVATATIANLNETVSTVVSGKYYKLTFTAVITSGNFTVTAGGWASSAKSTTATFTEYFYSSSTAAVTFDGGTAFTGTIDNVVLKQVSGVTFGSGSTVEVYPQWWTTNTTPGTTDMLSAFIWAVNAATNVKKIYVPADTYYFSDGFTIADNNIVIDSNYATLKVGAISTASFIDVTGDNVVIQNLIIDGQNEAVGKMGIKLEGDSDIVRNNSIVGFYMPVQSTNTSTNSLTENNYLKTTTVNMSSFGYGGYGTSGSVIGNYIVATATTGANYSVGVYLHGGLPATKYKILNNYIDTNGGYDGIDMRGSDHLVADNYIANAVEAGIITDSTTVKTIIKNNTLENNVKYGIAFFPTTTVLNSIVEGNILNNCGTGDSVIAVYPDSDVNSEVNLAIKSNVIVGGLIGIQIRHGYNTANRLSNFSITSNQISNVTNRGIYINRVKNVIISNNTVSNSVTDGISVYRTDQAIIEGNLTFDNDFNSSGTYAGIRYYTSINGIISGNIAFSTTGTTKQAYGLYFNDEGVGTSNVTLGKNNFSSNVVNNIRYSPYTIINGLDNQQNLLTNSSFAVWSNSTLENIGSNLVTEWTNWGGGYAYETFTSLGANITSAINTTDSGIANSNALNLTLGKRYKVVATLTLNSGTAPQLLLATCAGAGTGDFSQTLANGVNTIYFEFTQAGENCLLVVTDSAVATNYSCTFTVYEVAPGTVVADTKMADGWTKTSGVQAWREFNGGTSQGGSYSALKVTGDISSGTVEWSDGGKSAKREFYKRFANRNITLGAWVNCSSASKARISIADSVGSTYSSYHTGGGTYEWLEVTRSVASTITSFSVSLDAGISTTAYFSQPMLVYGSFIGAGNYNPIDNEIIWVETPIASTTLDAVSSKSDTAMTTIYTDGNNTLTTPPDNLYKFAKGAKAIFISAKVNDAGTTEAYLALRADAIQVGQFEARIPAGLTADGIVGAQGWQRLDVNSNYQYQIEATGSGTFDIPKFKILGVQY